MVLMRMSAFSALLTSAAFIGQHSNPKNAKIEWDKKKAFNPIVPSPVSLQAQKNDADEFNFKALNQTNTTEKADLFLEFPEKSKTLQAIKPEQSSGPVCELVVPIYQKPNPHCGLTPDDATLLAKSAIKDKNFSNMESLMGKIKTPWDILTGDRAIAQVLDEANIKATPEQVRANNKEALFLRHMMEEGVIHEGTCAKLDAACLLKARFSMMDVPTDLIRRTGHVVAYRSVAADGKLKQKEARLLAESFILNKPLKNRLEKLEKEVIGFKDLVVLEGEAIQILEEACKNTKCAQDKTQLAMNFIVMSGKVKAQHLERIKDPSWTELNFQNPWY